MSQQKQGILRSWHEEKGYGLVTVTRRESYFLHTNNVVEGPEIPAIGSVVLFDVAPPRKNGKFDQAVNAMIKPQVPAKDGVL